MILRIFQGALGIWRDTLSKSKGFNQRQGVDSSFLLHECKLKKSHTY